MSKIVDHNQRRLMIAEATLRTIQKSGMKGASVRNIAQESGLSLGALRHYFSTQDELLLFSMELVKERVTERIRLWLDMEISPMSKVQHVLMEILPTDPSKRVEMEVWFSFVVHYRDHDAYNLDSDGIRNLVKRLVYYMYESGILQSGLDLNKEIERLYALIDGLALHAYLNPEHHESQDVTGILDYHLRSISTEQAWE